MAGIIIKSDPLNGCTALEPITLDDEAVAVILYVERGGCSFVTKAYNAQLSGLDMVIIANNDPDRHKFNDILIDDGTNREINIPVAIISQVSAGLLSQVLNNEEDNEVWGSVDFELQKTILNGDVTELELWISSGDERTYDFIYEFSDYTGILASKVLVESGEDAFILQPRYVVNTCIGCEVVSKSQIGPADCMGNDNYCAMRIGCFNFQSQCLSFARGMLQWIRHIERGHAIDLHLQSNELSNLGDLHDAFLGGVL